MIDRSESSPAEFEPSDLARRKGRMSDSTGNACVEVTCISDVTLIRDSKNRRGRWLAFPRDTWDTLLSNMQLR